MKYFLYVLVCLILIQSCSIEKRHYTRGYHVEWNKNYKTHISLEQDSSIAETQTSHTDVLIPLVDTPIKNHNTSAKSEVDLSLCSSKEENKISQIVKAILPNAKPDALSENKSENKSTQETAVPVPNEQAKLSLFFGLLTWLLLIATYAISLNVTFFIPGLGLILFLSTLLFAILAVVYGNIALGEIDVYPNKYSNRGSASMGVALGLTYLILLILVVTLLLLLISLFLGI